MQDQQRIYTIKTGEMAEWLDEWKRLIARLRQLHGFEIVGACPGSCPDHSSTAALGMSAPGLRIDRLLRRYGDLVALRDVSLQVAAGERALRGRR